jgi:hypothetical protein
MTQQPIARKLTDLLTPEAHQRLIDRLSKQLNPATPELNKQTLRRIEWHTTQYQKKTGQLPK